MTEQTQSSSNQDSTAPEGEFASQTSQAAAEETSEVQASPEHNQEVLGASGSGSSDPSLEKDPSEWVTGGDPITSAQKSYLDTLARQAGEEIPADITKGEASEEIERLRKETGKD